MRNVGTTWVCDITTEVKRYGDIPDVCIHPGCVFPVSRRGERRTRRSCSLPADQPINIDYQVVVDGVTCMLIMQTYSHGNKMQASTSYNDYSCYGRTSCNLQLPSLDCITCLRTADTKIKMVCPFPVRAMMGLMDCELRKAKIKCCRIVPSKKLTRIIYNSRFATD